MDANKISFGVLIMSVGSAVNDLLDDLRSKIVLLDERLFFLNSEKARLEAGDIFYAVEYWRADKYMYLNYLSSKGEKRKREYIGADPAKIEKARQGILRAKEYDSLLQEISELIDIYSQVSELVKESSRIIEKKL